ncbi:MAG TPA: twin-arginine translocase TatA/TatE family subunit [Pyrinomonadaceae bacterium]
MHSFLLVFEFLGTTELLVIAVVALILFGPRKLPEIGRTVGKAMGEFKRASEDFKRTWEYEVEVEKRRPATEEAAPTAQTITPGEDAAALPAYDASVGEFDGSHPQPAAAEETIARGAAEEDAGGQGLADEHAWDVATGRAPTSPDAEEPKAS